MTFLFLGSQLKHLSKGLTGIHQILTIDQPYNVYSKYEFNNSSIRPCNAKTFPNTQAHFSESKRKLTEFCNRSE